MGLGFDFSFLDELGGVAADDGPRGDVLEDATTCTDHSSLADGDAHADEGVGSDPCGVLDYYWGGDEGVVDVRDVMSCSTEKSSLANYNIITNGDGCFVVKLRVGTYASVFAHGEVPRRPDFATLVNQRFPWDLCAK